MVAFVADTTPIEPQENAVFVAKRDLAPQMVAPPIGGTRYSPCVQINNANKVVTYDEDTSLQTKLTRIALRWFDPERVVDPDKPFDWENVASGQADNPGANFDAVFAYPGLNNNGTVVFSALGRIPLPCILCLASGSKDGIDSMKDIPSGQSLRLKLADDGKSVAKDGLEPNAPIRVYGSNLSPVAGVINPAYFSELGRYPAQGFRP
jgi:hypothetical protein